MLASPCDEASPMRPHCVERFTCSLANPMTSKFRRNSLPLRHNNSICFDRGEREPHEPQKPGLQENQPRLESDPTTSALYAAFGHSNGSGDHHRFCRASPLRLGKLLVSQRRRVTASNGSPIKGDDKGPVDCGVSFDNALSTHFSASPPRHRSPPLILPPGGNPHYLPHSISHTLARRFPCASKGRLPEHSPGNFDAIFSDHSEVIFLFPRCPAHDW